ncbi:hypothetical protein, partial [Marivivens sp.]|uniref:hypothetical protein n=1 Tax=Marivivens sp. TaxID=1978374 RepID=UPI0025B8DD34
MTPNSLTLIDLSEPIERQRDDRQAGAGDLVEGRLDGIIWLAGKRAAMADEDLAFVAVAQGG